MKAPKERNAVVLGMILRSQKGGAHTDRKKESARRRCRGRPVDE